MHCSPLRDCLHIQPFSSTSLWPLGAFGYEASFERFVLGVQISYMGTKRYLAPTVSAVIAELPDGPLLDAFSGMGAIAEAVADSREVWVNDCGSFASTVSSALFTSRTGPPSRSITLAALETAFHKNAGALEQRFANSLSKEQKYFNSKDIDDAISGNIGLPWVGSCKDLQLQQRRLARKPNTFPYRLASITYPGSYFGMKQCIEIDSIRYAVELARSNKVISRDEARWLLVALCQVMSRVNNSTGQFAQFIKPTQANLTRVISKRQRSVWNEFLQTVSSLNPVGTQEWRAGNRSYRSDAASLLSFLKTRGDRPAVIYADPPYSKAEYSRYYHVLDALVDYRYAVTTADGRYPTLRKPVKFGRLRTVAQAMERVLARSATLGSTLILSYPSSGLFHQTGADLMRMLRKYYKKVEIAYEEVKQHSTFGGPQAPPSVQVIEHVYLASNT